MDTTFRERIEPSQEPEIAPQTIETPGVVEDTEGLTKLKEGQESDRLDLWEFDHKRQFTQDYFNIRETAHIFPMSVQSKFIDKYVKGELESRGYEKTKTNYQTILQEIEEQIGTGNLQSYKRLQKITGYIQAIQKLNKAKELRNRYLIQ
jgi:hypothetical protein